ncbi:MAG: sugar phosphate isomerase/epimerase family protein [Terriglobia bacterium]
MSTRREFLQQAAALAAASAVPASILAAPASTIHLGAQTNAWGVPITGYGHLMSILDVLGQLGFQGFETNFKTMSPFADRAAQIRRAFESRRIRFVASHNGSALYLKDKVAAQIESLRRAASASASMGAIYFIVSGRSLPHPSGKLDMDAVRVWTDSLNRLGRVVKQEGLKLCYHNHSQEFEDHPSQLSFFFRETDPKLVWLNFDDGHAYGLIPSVAAFSAEHFRRIAIYHFKDMKHGAGGKTVQTPMGEGQVDLKGMVAPLIHSGWNGWLEAEEDFVYPKPIPDPKGVLGQWITYTRGLITTA